ncbi:MAG: glycosyltransferase family 4 protein [Thermoanaerobacterales bacterium]|nr:glycosyltransferase family 4 protein [Bacillota bacterium]MDI6907182.1 glycosyltransferase family 4 protein [Thermoanaerobacterales bacterium]
MRERVLQVIRPAAGGMKNHLLTLVRAAVPSYEVLVACPPGELAAEAEAAGAEVIPVPLRGELNPVSDARCAYHLARAVRHLRIDLVHVHGAKAGLVGRPAARLGGVRGIIYTVHNSILYEDWPAWKRWMLAHAEAGLSRLTDRIITVSENLRRELIEREGIEASRIVTIYNGIAPGRFDAGSGARTAIRWELGLAGDAPVIGTVARLAPQKGITYLIRALALLRERMPDVRGVVVGDGPLRATLEREAEECGVPVVFAGYRTDIPALMAAFDVFVLPSVTEGLPLIVLEAMASGRAVVATAVGGLPEAVAEGETGLLVPPKDPDALCAALQFLLNAPGGMARMGAAGRERVFRMFTSERMVQKTLDVYRQILGTTG